jgi:hypothetical protein
MPKYAVLRVRHGKPLVPKVPRAFQGLVSQAELDRNKTWSKNKANVEAWLSRYRSDALTELIVSLVAVFRCLTERGKTDHALRCAAGVLHAASIAPRGGLWELGTLHQRVQRAGRIGKVEEIGVYLLSSEPALAQFVPAADRARVLARIRERTKTEFDESILAVIGREYRAQPPRDPRPQGRGKLRPEPVPPALGGTTPS